MDEEAKWIPRVQMNDLKNCVLSREREEEDPPFTEVVLTFRNVFMCFCVDVEDPIIAKIWEQWRGVPE